MFANVRWPEISSARRPAWRQALNFILHRARSHLPRDVLKSTLTSTNTSTYHAVCLSIVFDPFPESAFAGSFQPLLQLRRLLFQLVLITNRPMKVNSPASTKPMVSGTRAQHKTCVVLHIHHSAQLQLLQQQVNCETSDEQFNNCLPVRNAPQYSQRSSQAATSPLQTIQNIHRH